LDIGRYFILKIHSAEFQKSRTWSKYGKRVETIAQFILDKQVAVERLVLENMNMHGVKIENKAEKSNLPLLHI